MKKLSLILSVAFLFAAQSTHGQWVVLPGFPVKSPSVAARPMVLLAALKAAFTAQTEPAASKELWLGDARLSFHVEARESLNVVYGSSLLKKIARSQAWENLKPVLMRAALIAVLQENGVRPIEHQMFAARLIQKSA